MPNLLPFVELAIRRRGYVHAWAAPMIAELLEASWGDHPHEVARQLRKAGDQLSADEKRRMGLRSNTMMSVGAAACLTETGRADPIRRLDSTLLDAIFACFRANSVEVARKAGCDRFRLESLHGDCEACKALDGRIVSGDALTDLPPPDCQRDACSLTIVMRHDRLSRL